ncbi:MAG: hypothetical protein R2835_00800 [Thermomicrobiales bacterium]
MGDVIGDLNSRRGQIQGMEARAGAQVVKAFVPLAQMFGYATDLDRPLRAARSTRWNSITMRRCQRISRRRWSPRLGARLVNATLDSARWSGNRNERNLIRG